MLNKDFNLVYTYYTNSGTQLNCGFARQEGFRKVFSESVKQSKRLFSSVILNTDKEGKLNLESFLDISGIEIRVKDYKHLSPDSRFWNYPKILSYSYETKPFLHIDTDVVLHDNFSIDKGFDIYTELYRPCLEPTYKYKNVLDSVNLTDDFNRFAFIICSGLLGFSDVSIVKEYKELVDKSIGQLSLDPVSSSTRTAVEEYILSSLKNRYDKKIKQFDQNTFTHYQGKVKNYL